jgi:hypothetical protein
LNARYKAIVVIPNLDPNVGQYNHCHCKVESDVVVGLKMVDEGKPLRVLHCLLFSRINNLAGGGGEAVDVGSGGTIAVGTAGDKHCPSPCTRPLLGHPRRLRVRACGTGARVGGPAQVQQRRRKHPPHSLHHSCL